MGVYKNGYNCDVENTNIIDRNWSVACEGCTWRPVCQSEQLHEISKRREMESSWHI